MFTDARFKDGPQEGYLKLAAEAPSIFYTPRNGGHWVMTRSEEMVSALQTTGIFSSVEATIPPPPDGKFLSMNPQDIDPPDHTKFRRLISPIFAPKAVQKLEEDSRRLITNLIDDMIANGRCEFVEQVAVPFPVLLFVTMAGMDKSRYLEFTS